MCHAMINPPPNGLINMENVGKMARLKQNEKKSITILIYLSMLIYFLHPVKLRRLKSFPDLMIASDFAQSPGLDHRGTSLIRCGDSENACFFLTKSRSFLKNACLFLEELRNFQKTLAYFLHN